MENTQSLFFGKTCTGNRISLVPANNNNVITNIRPIVNIYRIEHGGIQHRFLEEKLKDISIPMGNEYTENELCNYITALLSSFLDESIIPHLVNTETMKEWNKCFTHVTFDPVNNYETYESVGDKVMSYTFKTFVYMKIPDITDGELNNLDQLYMSTNLQSYISNHMRLSYWLKKHRDVQVTSEKRQEDVLEAFFGTIDTILIKNTNFGYGFGVKTCLKFFEKIFSLEDLQANRIYEPPKTFFQQVFQRLGIPSDTPGFIELPARVVTDSGGDKQLIELKLTDVSIRVLSYLGKLPKQTNWNYRAGTKKEASSKLYLQAASSFYDAGITSEWIIEYKATKDKEIVSDALGDGWYGLILSKVQRLDPDVKDVVIKNTYTDLKTVIYQIIGVTSNTKKIIFSYSFDKGKSGNDKNNQLVSTVRFALETM